MRTPGTHFEGPLTGSNRASGGIFEDCSLGLTDQFRGPYLQRLELFRGMASIADLETDGWVETPVGTAAARSWAYNEALGLLVINADTVAEEGTNAQANAAATAAAIHHAHNLIGPITSTTTLMDGRELIWATRVGFLNGAGTVWNSAALFGWFVTDAALMTPATGALAIATGGGIGFHITQAGQLNAVVQGTTAATSTDTSLDMGTMAATFGNFWDLGFRWRCVDASSGTGVVDFFVNGRRVVRVNGATTALPMQSTEVYSNTIEVINGPAAADQVDVGLEYIYNAISRAGLTYPYTSGLNL